MVTWTLWDIGRVAQRRAAGAAGVDVDQAVVQRLSRLPEPRVLDYFWLMARAGADPLWLLLHVGQVVIVRPADWDRAAIRRAHERGPRAWEPRLGKRWCFACLSQASLYHHHVIEVQHGGSNALRNRVPLCFPCHQYLHPWLTTEAALPVDAVRLSPEQPGVSTRENTSSSVSSSSSVEGV